MKIIKKNFFSNAIRYITNEDMNGNSALIYLIFFQDGNYRITVTLLNNEFEHSGVYANIQLRLFTISNAYYIDASIVSKKYHDEYNFSLTNKSVFYLKNIQNGLIKKIQQSETANEKLSDKQSLSLIGDGDLKGFINELFCSKVFDELLNDIFKNMGL